MLGSQFGQTSPAQPPIPIQILHVCVLPGARTELTLPSGHRGFAYAMAGHGLFGDNTRVDARHVALLSPGDGHDGTLAVSNLSAESSLHFLLVSGEPLHAGPLYKKLGHGGSFIGRTEEAVRTMKARFEAAGEGYGRE